MSENDQSGRLEEAEKTITFLREELNETHKGLMALTIELEKRNEQMKDAMMHQVWQVAKLAAVGELAACIAHELNNPLATVSLKLESLLAGFAEGTETHREIVICEQEVERMGGLVAGLLSFSRKNNRSTSTIDVRQEINQTLVLIEHHLRLKGIVVEREFPDELPMIIADRQGLRQVYLNLFTNAIDAMEQGGTLTISLRAYDTGESDKKTVTIEISDTGIGIQPDNMQKIQDAFFTTKPEGKGTGLGLAICRRIVKEHGGTMAIESTEGKGTKVLITLPAGGNGKNGKHLTEGGL